MATDECLLVTCHADVGHVHPVRARLPADPDHVWRPEAVAHARLLAAAGSAAAEAQGLLGAEAPAPPGALEHHGLAARAVRAAAAAAAVAAAAAALDVDGEGLAAVDGEVGLSAEPGKKGIVDHTFSCLKCYGHSV